MSPLLLLALVAFLIWLVVVFGRGFFWLARERDDPAAPDLASWPPVAAVIPARDEADMIGGTLASLFGQDYPGAFSVVLVDDGSSDGTADVARAAAVAAGAAERLAIVAGGALPAEWTGKLYALKQGVDHVAAAGQAPAYLLFTDADIMHAPDSVRRLVARARADNLVLVSLMAKLRCASWAERALVPAFIFFFDLLYPFGFVNDPRRRTAAAAGGCMLLDRPAFLEAGGVAAVRAELIDDCAVGRLMKRHGPIRLSLTERVLSQRPYQSFDDMRRMIARSAFAQLRYSLTLLIGTVVGLGATFLAAPLLAVLGHGPAQAIGVAIWVVMALVFQPMLAFYDVSPAWGIALPAIAFVYLGFTIDSARLYYRGLGGRWKGRTQAMGSRRS